MTESFVITRVLQAPQSLVWKVWTDAVHLSQWWGPPGCSLRIPRLELRPGGVFLFEMQMAGGEGTHWAKFTYEEVTPIGRLVYLSAFSDEAGTTGPNPWDPRFPRELRNELTLSEAGGRTTLTLTVSAPGTTSEGIQTFLQEFSNMQEGFGGTFDKLETYLAEAGEADRTIAYHRTFDAPPSLVWKAWTTPSSIAAWWGPSGFGNTIKAMDVRAGGSWQFIMHGPDGVDYPNEVTYLTVEEPSTLVYDHGSPGGLADFRVTVTFTPHGERTEMRYKMVFPTAEAKRLVVEKYGAVEGLKQNMDRFAHWLQKTGLVLTRVFQAPRPLVWKAFTDPVQLVKWWGPEHFTCPGAQVDLHIGGRYLLGMKGPDGAEFWGTGTYREIILNQKLVYTDQFADAAGHVVSAASLGLPGDWPEEPLVTVTFAELGKEKTLVTIHHHQLPEEWKEMTVSGWSSSFDKLSKVLA